VRAEPHDFLPRLTTPPAIVLRILQATAGLPSIRAPGIRHHMLPRQPTEGNPELRVLAVRDRPRTHRDRAVVLSRVQPGLPALLRVWRIQEEAHGGPGAEEERGGRH